MIFVLTEKEKLNYQLWLTKYSLRTKKQIYVGLTQTDRALFLPALKSKIMSFEYLRWVCFNKVYTIKKDGIKRH